MSISHLLLKLPSLHQILCDLWAFLFLNHHHPYKVNHHELTNMYESFQEHKLHLLQDFFLSQTLVMLQTKVTGGDVFHPLPKNMPSLHEVHLDIVIHLHSLQVFLLRKFYFLSKKYQKQSSLCFIS
ncbi:Uncharacterised protein [Streptococcus pneumoniae]|nr:Uncharacterised protein [Streptococcus pneumoniae]CKE75041.1 Uncharacterised protein [Streptococcus pneumoniae]